MTDEPKQPLAQDDTANVKNQEGVSADAPHADESQPKAAQPDAPASSSASAPTGQEATSALQAELAAAKQDVLYAQAEIQNVRRRMEREVKDAHSYAATRFARDLLSVADNLQRALAAIPDWVRDDEKGKPLLTGIEATARELEAAFQRNGITRFSAMGEKLDPNRHQAMVEMPSDAEVGTVIQEMAPGYMIGDRLLRPAMVGVARKPD